MTSIEISSLPLGQRRPGRYARSFQTADGAVHILGLFKVVDEGTRIDVREDSDPSWGLADLTEGRCNTMFGRGPLFLGLQNRATLRSDSTYETRMWRSSGGLGTLAEDACVTHLPEAGTVDYDPDLWSGLFFHRSILELEDGSLLAAMYGNFETDVTRPSHPWSRTETKYKLRAFAVRSTDEGKTWRYRASVAVPDPDVEDATEGFNEWTMTRLADGRLLAVVRTGHFTPLVASWSDDEGLTWTPPRTPAGLGPAGGDPNLLTLENGRLALAFGEMVQPDASDANPFGGLVPGVDRQRKCRLAVADDGLGETWEVTDVCDYGDRSAYATIHEVSPNVLVYQADLDIWRVELG